MCQQAFLWVCVHLAHTKPVVEQGCSAPLAPPLRARTLLESLIQFALRAHRTACGTAWRAAQWHNSMRWVRVCCGVGRALFVQCVSTVVDVVVSVDLSCEREGVGLRPIKHQTKTTKTSKTRRQQKQAHCRRRSPLKRRTSAPSLYTSS